MMRLLWGFLFSLLSFSAPSLAPGAAPGLPQAQVEPSPFVAIQMFTHPLWRFFNFYVLRGGFLEGGRGLYAAMSAAFYVFLKYAKIYEKRVRAMRPR